MDTLRFRALWALIAAAEAGSTNRAARALNLTQPAVSHAIKLIEAQLGVTLFNRRPKGLAPTDLGAIFVRRAHRALQQLKAAENEILRMPSASDDKERLNGFHRKVTRQQLAVLVRVAECGSVQYAALDTGLSQAVIWHALRELRGLVGETVVENRTRGITLSAAGEILVRHAKLAFAEIRHAHDDLAAAQGRISGRVTIGALPLSRTILVPRAVADLSRRHPNIEFSIVDGPYNTLLSALRCGDLDMIVGALRSPAPASDVSEETLFSEPLSVAARLGHPLTRRSNLSIADLINEDWVVPIRGTPTRKIFDALLTENGLRPTKSLIESSSLVATRALLLESDYLTIISRSQIYYEETFGILTALPVSDLARTARPIGITSRSDATLPPAAQELVSRLRALSGELYGTAPAGHPRDSHRRTQDIP